MKSLVFLALLGAMVQADTVFTPCDGNFAYNIDLSNTYTDPAQPVKGKDITLYVNGLMTQAVTLNEMDLTVDWDNTQIAKVPVPETDVIAAMQPYTLTFKVNIPSFAPSGDFSITADIEGTPTGGSKTEVGCFAATFTL